MKARNSDLNREESFNNNPEVATNKDAIEQCKVGYRYFVEKKYAEAFSWYMLAASGGHKMAKIQIARMYEDGKGVEKDEDKAAEWFAKAGVNRSSRTKPASNAAIAPTPSAPPLDDSEVEQYAEHNANKVSVLQNAVVAISSVPFFGGPCFVPNVPPPAAVKPASRLSQSCSALDSLGSNDVRQSVPEFKEPGRNDNNAVTPRFGGHRSQVPSTEEKRSPRIGGGRNGNSPRKWVGGVLRREKTEPVCRQQGSMNK